MIKEAAILKDGKIYTGYRHDVIIRAYPPGFFISRGEECNSIQGFVTDKGKFLNRKEAGKHAYECGQINKLINCLMSEDLY